MYTLRLPQESRVHPTFHVSLLKKCRDPSLTPVHIHEDEVGRNAVRVPLKICDRRIVRKHGRAVTEVLVQWKDEAEEESSWEDWQEFQSKYPAFIEHH